MRNNALILCAAVVIAALTGSITTLVALSARSEPTTTNNTTMREIVPSSRDVAYDESFKQNPAPRAEMAANREQYPDLTFAAETAVRSVVHIEATVDVGYSRYVDPLAELFGYGSRQGTRGEAIAGGSGVILSEDGYIVTNNHVIENAKRLRVSLYDGRAFEATVVGSDPDTDVALIKIDATGLTTLPFGSSDELRLGEWVLAIGYPMELQTTVTAGIVSAKARHLGALGYRTGIESFIQTDAVVNPGNSGGALVNTRGELVGINTIIKTSTGSYVGYSFAVPETIVRKVTTDLKECGSVQRAVVGITFTEVNQDFIDSYGAHYGIDSIGGIYVSSIADGGAADNAGIREGDIITAFDGTMLNDTATFLEQVGKHRPGDKVTLRLRRADKEYDVEVVLQNRSGNTSLKPAAYRTSRR